MVPKRILRITTKAKALGLAFVIAITVPAQTPGAKQGQNNNKQADDLSSHLIWVRILPFELRDKGWQLSDKNGQDVLNIIKELKPDVLNRFITGRPDLSIEVPMGPDASPMKFADYLTAAMKAGAPGCFLTPKDHLNDVWPEQYRMEAAQALYDLPVTPRLKVMDLDEFFTHGTPEEQQHVLETFKAMGWRDLGYNFAGGPKPAFGLITYAEAGINKTTWEVNQKALAAMKDEGIRVRLAHIDYPGAIAEFKKLSPDDQADIIQKISRQQRQYDFTFIYPVIYARAGYDASKQVTRSDGPYKGATVLQIIKEDIECDRHPSGPCAIQFAGQPAANSGDAPK